MSDSNPFSPVTEVLLHEAWAHLEDCDIVTEDDVELVHAGTWSAADVIACIQRTYEGGWSQFCKDIEPLEAWQLTYERRDDRGRLLGVTEKSSFGNTRYRSMT